MISALSVIGRTLRSPVVPRSLSYQAWRLARRGSAGERFFFRAPLFGKQIVYGGVCGSSDDALFADLETYERDTISVVASLLNQTPDPVVIDVGANNGQILVIVKALCDSVKVHCFEPFPELSDFLDELVIRNSFRDVYINNSLVGDYDGERELYFQDSATDTASVVPDFQSTFNNKIKATQCTLDSYVKRSSLQHIDLIKIDVEGGEREVLRGARNTLEMMRPNILLELLHTQNASHRARQQEVIVSLREIGYRFFQIRTHGMEEQEHVTPDPDYVFLNYLVTARAESLPRFAFAACPVRERR